MLVLRRKVGESVVIDGGITVTVVDSRAAGIGLGFVAPKGVKILRSELESKPEKPKDAEPSEYQAVAKTLREYVTDAEQKAEGLS